MQQESRAICQPAPEATWRGWPYSVVVAAVANKLARTIWAVLSKGKPWQPVQW